MTEHTEDERPLLRKDTIYRQIAAHTWVDIDKLSVHIERTRDGVRVEIWPIVDEGSRQPLARAFAPFDAVKLPRLRNRLITRVRHLGPDDD
jgi:hypothetical protein